MSGYLLIAILPRVENPIPDTIGVGFIFSTAGAGGVVMLVLGSSLGFPMPSSTCGLGAASAQGLRLGESSTRWRCSESYYEDNAPHFERGPCDRNRPYRRRCGGVDSTDRHRRWWRIRVPFGRHVRVLHLPDLARAHTLPWSASPRKGSTRWGWTRTAIGRGWSLGSVRR